MDEFRNNLVQWIDGYIKSEGLIWKKAPLQLNELVSDPPCYEQHASHGRVTLNPDQEKIMAQLRSISLLTDSNGAFIKFINKYIGHKIVDKMWTRVSSDHSDNGYLEHVEDLAIVIAFIGMLYTVKIYQKRTQTKEKPPINKQELLDEVDHISAWIVKKQTDENWFNDYNEPYPFQPMPFSMTKDDFTNNLTRWMNEYLQCEDIADMIAMLGK